MKHKNMIQLPGLLMTRLIKCRIGYIITAISHNPHLYGEVDLEQQSNPTVYSEGNFK